MPTPSYCPNCGAPITPDQLFCTNCGARIVAAGADATQVNAVNPEAGGMMGGGTGIQGTQELAPMPSVPQYAGTDHQQPSHHPSSHSRAKLIGLVAGCVAAGAVAAALVFHFVVSPQQQAQFQQQQDQQQQQSDQAVAQAQQDASDAKAQADAAQQQADAAQQQANQAAQAQADAAAAAQAKANAQKSAQDAADQQFHSTLVSYYNALSDYDRRIRNAATNFNNNYLSASASTRSGYSDDATGLQYELEAQIANLYSLSMPQNSAYATQFSLLQQCYNDCYHRISVIADAWTTDVQYSDPSAHQDEILEPIQQDNVHGTNRYKTDYDNTYPQISL
ncbi:MAG: zinc ribbon domain-containing protein [Atopobiaceae bacterium]